jgi:GNAT superfamily N-acetyltransferase
MRSKHGAPFFIRKATGGDAQGILKCLHAAFEAYRDSYTPNAFLDTVLTPETVEQRLATMCVYVATDTQGDIVGTIACNVINQKEGHIRGMAVLPAWQGAGVAAQLLKSVESELSEKGCSIISLDTTDPLRAARRFYEKSGFRPTCKITDFFGMPLFEYFKRLPNKAGPGAPDPPK